MSFNIAISGLNATNKQLNTISNNIANVSTYGFKESRAEFASIYNGGQAGGVEVSGITQNFDRNGSLEATGRALDLAISGNGFFATVDNKGQQIYTRSGAFSTDKDNFIVSSAGNKLQGYTVDAKANLQKGNIDDLAISTASLSAKATDSIEFTANFDARATPVASAAFDPADPTSFTSSYTAQAFDSLGNAHTVSQYFINTGSNQWNIKVIADDNDVTPDPAPVIEFTTEGLLADTSTIPILVSIPALGANLIAVEIDLTGSTQYGADFGVSTNNPNGYTAGELTGIRVEDNGMIFAQFTNGQSQLQGQLVLADFPNPTALEQSNNTSWMQTFGSGTPVKGAPGSGVLGKLTSNMLETSNVDLTSELVSLMTAQRNYQANTKTISTADQLTKALFNAV
ncbi:flagellar hook protein FlgE [Psychromonas ingrahamii 37]|uniref:Flagellar hook protein FlgE n=1 Tax=Psychromonas ingrahamii (strain DSM 17664 / CCUG 51855 / 37) TaxID=357804 RepID=A1T0J3_PSYIN|nr:flagellar hook protein FlgE [Psychromonas ingrahamii]ABM05258.1 flagellar hook protein FlgE [Psychromonas ingrahamii 37]